MMADDPRDVVFMNLPSTYRRAGQGSPMHVVARSLGVVTSQLERASRGVLQAHSVLAAGDLADLEQLAALLGLTPWQQEDADGFRYRLLTTARIRLRGAGTARAMLEMAGAAYNAELLELVLPGHVVPEQVRDVTGVHHTDTYTTMGLFRRRRPPYQMFLARVVDMPPKPQGNAVTLSGVDFEFNVGSYVSGDDGGQLSGPTFELTAQAAGFALPVLLHRDTGRLALINRRLSRGQALRVDLDQGSAVGGDVGGVLVDGQPGPPVLYGTASFLDSAPGEVTGAVLPKAGLGKAALTDWLPGTTTGWRLAPGLSHWRWMLAVGPDGAEPPDTVSLPDLRLLPCPPRRAPKALTVGWTGRRPGEFTMQFRAMDRADAEWGTELQGEVMRIRPHPVTGEFVVISEQAEQPVIEFVAGALPVVAPILVQRDVQRILLVNKVIPPGSILQIDLTARQVKDVSDAPSLPGPVMLNGKPAPDLLYGAVAGLLDQSAALLDDTAGARLVYWAPSVSTDQNWVPPPADSGGWPATLPWPPLVPLGRSDWRLMAGLNQAGEVPQRDERIALGDLRVVPSNAQIGPGELLMRWERQSGPPQPGVPQSGVPHDWLMEQIKALKLAGVLYV